MVKNKPAWVNVPQKEAYVALSPEARAPVNDMLVRFLLWMAVLLGVLFLYIQVGMFAVALGQWKGLPLWPMLVITGGVVAYIIVLYVMISRAIRRATEVTSKPS